jgi:predicted RNase H-like HicB family nuclease
VRYAVIIEDAGGKYSAYVPDLPGRIATGSTVEETESEIRTAIELHLGGMRSDNIPIHLRSGRVDYVEIVA